jgi:hypothetical protein
MKECTTTSIANLSLLLGLADDVARRHRWLPQLISHTPPAAITQSDIARAIRAAKQAGAAEVAISSDNNAGLENDVPRSFEREIHRRFAKYRVRGEWFVLSDKIRVYIAELRKTGGEL